MKANRPQIIVIGGSAGALEPVMLFLKTLPATVDVPIVLVMHIPPRPPSLLPDLLSKLSARRVVEPDDKEPLTPGTVYVAPPNYHLMIDRSGAFSLSVDDLVNFSRPSVDVLFECAADAYGAGVIGIVMSGANNDGAGGLARIVERGGTAFVQAPESSAYPTMPAAALERVPTATALAPEQLAHAVVRETQS
jgi:two-component system chemotaxis response regulator CheB